MRLAIRQGGLVCFFISCSAIIYLWDQEVSPCLNRNWLWVCSIGFLSMIGFWRLSRIESFVDLLIAWDMFLYLVFGWVCSLLPCLIRVVEWFPWLLDLDDWTLLTWQSCSPTSWPDKTAVLATSMGFAGGSVLRCHCKWACRTLDIVFRLYS